MNRRKLTAMLAVVALTAVAITATVAFAARRDPVRFGARLDGFQEVPAISTMGRGTVHLKETDRGLYFELDASGLSSTVVQAHIHFGRSATNGGVIAFLCGGDSKPVCPTGRQIHVTGVLTPSDVIGPVAQGIDPGQAREALRALMMRAAYANVHTTMFPNGEIRGQIGRID